MVHELAPKDAFRETREILDVDGGGELAAGGDVVGHPTLEEDGLELGTRGVYSHDVGSMTTSDDTYLGLEVLELVVRHAIELLFLCLVATLFSVFITLFTRKAT